jgi:hypothetical protein
MPIMARARRKELVMILEVVPLALIAGFAVMMTVGALTMPLRRPPLHHKAITCPEDYRKAVVALSWDPGDRQMRVVRCDHRRCSTDGQCSKACEADLQNAFPMQIATTVVP